MRKKPCDPRGVLAKGLAQAGGGLGCAGAAGDRSQFAGRADHVWFAGQRPAITDPLHRIRFQFGGLRRGSAHQDLADGVLQSVGGDQGGDCRQDRAGNERDHEEPEQQPPRDRTPHRGWG